MSQSVLFVDIDNTLYDWPSFFAPSFRAMIHAISKKLSIPEHILYEEAKAVFAKHKSLEYALVIQELESVKGRGPEEIRSAIEAGRGAFKIVQKKRLTPYPGVINTLEWLRKQDVIVIGITNSPLYRAQHRLFDLKLDSLMTGLVAWEGFEVGSDPASKGFVPTGLIRSRSRLDPNCVFALPESDCKPNENHYLLALSLFKSDASHAWAIGDSLTKDLAPASRVGIKTIWAKYGANFDPSDTDAATLLRITHWSQSKISSTYDKNGFSADTTVNSFADLKGIIPEKYLTLF